MAYYEAYYERRAGRVFLYALVLPAGVGVALFATPFVADHPPWTKRWLMSCQACWGQPSAERGGRNAVGALRGCLWCLPKFLLPCFVEG